MDFKTPNAFNPSLSRRDLLLRSGLGLGALGLNAVLADDEGSSNTATGSHFSGKAKRVIQFFLNGGPSHVDTFDHKPALAKYAGQRLGETLTTERKTGAAFPSPFKFQPYGESGIEVSELFSRTAQHIDDIAVIRSMYAQVPNHEPSLMLMNCGDSVQAQCRSVGAVRPGCRKQKPARLYRHVPRRAANQGRRELAVGFPSRCVSRNAYRHSAHAAKSID